MEYPQPAGGYFRVLSSSVRAFPSTSPIVVSVNVQIREALRARQSRLLSLSVRMTPLTGSPSAAPPCVSLTDALVCA